MKRFLTSCFGLGYLPVAPGTWGSLPAVLIFAMISLNASVLITSIAMAVIALTASVICVAFADAAIEATGKKDPGEIVADETAGQAIVFTGAGATGLTAILAVAAAGFILFRLFDIIKPWPCKRLENLPKGWGILADDLMAGLYAAIVLQIILGCI